MSNDNMPAVEKSTAKPGKGVEGKYIYRILCGAVITVLCVLLYALVWYRFVTNHNQTGHLLGRGNLAMSIGIYAIMTVVLLRALGGYKVGVNRKMNVMSSQIMALFTTDVLDVFISMAVTGQYRFMWVLTREYFLLWLLQSLVCAAITIPMINIYRKVFPPLQILEFYGEHNNHLSQKVNGVPYKYHVAKLVRYEDHLLDPERQADLKEEISRYDAVLVNDLPAENKNTILKICFDMNKRVYFLPKLSDIIVKASDDLNLFDTPLYLCRNIGMSWWQRTVKRFFDVFLSGLALILLSPVLLITAIAIHSEDGGPVFFRQERVTLNGKRFMILKFRSMIVDAEKDGRPHPAGEHDDRITRVGHVIRATRIDELPQLINIIKGDMSIVGPRPERWEHVEQYTQEIPEFAFRLKVKGGLTGYAQVYGKYNTTALDKLKLDLMYVTNYSLLLDIQIIFETIKIIFQKDSTEGFSEEDQSKFMKS